MLMTICLNGQNHTVQKMMDKGFLKGDENGCLGLTDELLRVFVINDRAGVYENRWDGKSE